MNGANTGKQISAQVAVKPGYASSAHAIADELSRAGFTVGAAVANNFSITAPRDRFDAFFGNSAIEAASTDLTGLTIPDGAIPALLKDKIEAIVFTHIDFGPGAFY